MKKFAIEVEETQTIQLFINADTYEQAEQKIKQAYNNGTLFLHNKSFTTLKCADCTERYKDIYREYFDNISESKI